jgi:hypothetical protein
MTNSQLKASLQKELDSAAQTGKVKRVYKAEKTTCIEFEKAIDPTLFDWLNNRFLYGVSLDNHKTVSLRAAHRDPIINAPIVNRDALFPTIELLLRTQNAISKDGTRGKRTKKDVTKRGNVLRDLLGNFNGIENNEIETFIIKINEYL